MMVFLAGLLLTGAALVVLVATSALVLQALGMIFRRDVAVPASNHRPSMLILVPAHNEAAGLGATLARLKAELSPLDHILVIADNCTDDTADVARRAGAEVLVRHDKERRGKGFALAAGLAQEARLSHEVVVFVDADGWFETGGLEFLGRACLALGVPVQCRYLMVAPPNHSRLAEFIWRVRNDFRPSGYARLGLPSQLFGAGMAMPSAMAEPSLFETGHITEDLLIGLECALAGAAPRYLRRVTLFSEFPISGKGREQQRQRWVHGHLALMSSHVPLLLRAALKRRSPALLAMALDMMTPPLTLLVAAHSFVVAVTLVFLATTGTALPFAVAATGAMLFGFAVATAWYTCGRDIIGVREIGQVPIHLIRVVANSLAFAVGRRSGWIRADRSRSS